MDPMLSRKIVAIFCCPADWGQRIYRQCKVQNHQDNSAVFKWSTATNSPLGCIRASGTKASLHPNHRRGHRETNTLCRFSGVSIENWPFGESVSNPASRIPSDLMNHSKCTLSATDHMDFNPAPGRKAKRLEGLDPFGDVGGTQLQINEFQMRYEASLSCSKESRTLLECHG